MATALFILGTAGSGKTKLAKLFIKSQLKLRRPRPWALLDKDTSGDLLGSALMAALGLDPNDRDSPQYREKVRDLEYRTCLNLAREQLKLGINVVIPGPWTKELNSGQLFSADALGLPLNTRLRHVYLDVALEAVKARIIARDNPRDLWKIENWDLYVSRIHKPEAISERNIKCLTMTETEEDLIEALVQECKRPELP